MSTTTRTPWFMLVCATLIMIIIAGSRQTIGLFIAPLNAANGLGIVAISFAVAIGQLMWGVAQPSFGALADRYGPLPVLVAGALMVTAGLAITPFTTSEWALVLSLGVLSGAGAGAGSFAVLIGSAARLIPPERRGVSSGMISAGGSIGQFVFAPLAQALITGFGWVSAMISLAMTALLTIPLSLPLRRQASAQPAAKDEVGMRAQLRIAFADTSYRWILLGFFTCGFHIAFLVTHLPGQVSLCALSPQVAANTIGLIGAANIVGTLGGGMLASRFRLKVLLFWLYLSRTVVMLGFLIAPKTEFTFYVFAIALGLSWLATVPPTVGLVGKLFGVRYLATLAGFAMLFHQFGAFLGAWLGGFAVARYGDYSWMFVADALLALMAAIVSLPVREARLARPHMA